MPGNASERSGPLPRAAPPSSGARASIDSEEALDAALAELLAQDAEFVAHMLERGGRPPLRRQDPGFEGLCAIIVSQQVSTASARAIFGRLRTAIAPFEPEGLLSARDEILKTCGLSIQKIRALRRVAEAVASNALPLAALARMPAEDAARALVAIKGVGPWTAEVFLLFCLGHPDVWPAGDLALQEAARVLLKLDRRPDRAALERIGERWRPLRGVAARLLWSYYRTVKSRDGIGLGAR